jgi:hypothetical protein
LKVSTPKLLGFLGGLEKILELKNQEFRFLDVKTHSAYVEVICKQRAQIIHGRYHHFNKLSKTTRLWKFIYPLNYKTYIN